MHGYADLESLTTQEDRYSPIAIGKARPTWRIPIGLHMGGLTILYACFSPSLS